MYDFCMWIYFVLLSTLAWALVNILNSVLVHHHIKSPVVLTWIQSLISLPLLLILSFNIDITSSWSVTLLLFGITAYFGDLWFFYVLKHVDASVLNASWSILSLLLSLTGFIFLGEKWSIYQSFGAFLIIGGTLLLSLYHKHINFRRTLLLFSILAVLYLPYYLAKKVAVDNGGNALSVFFWLLVGRELLSLVVPIFSSTVRKSTYTTIKSSHGFLVLCLITTILYILAEYFGTLAYLDGPLSLVAIFANLQPFFVIGIGWAYYLASPLKAPKELFTKESIKIKMLSFGLVFVGTILVTRAY